MRKKNKIMESRLDSINLDSFSHIYYFNQRLKFGAKLQKLLNLLSVNQELLRLHKS